MGSPRKPKTVERTVSDAAVSVVTYLASRHPEASYDEVRGKTIRLFAGLFAAAYGMAPPIALDAELSTILASLDFPSLTPEHFGHVHETLLGWTLVDGKIAPSSERRRKGAHFTPRSMTEPGLGSSQ